MALGRKGKGTIVLVPEIAPSEIWSKTPLRHEPYQPGTDVACLHLWAANQIRSNSNYERGPADPVAGRCADRCA